MKLAIIDDNLAEAQYLEKQIRECMSKKRIHAIKIDLFTSSDQFLKLWTPWQYEVILLDIFIDNRSGLEVAELIRQKDQNTALVFCSTSNEFAAESYHVNASYYLVKPADKDKIFHMLERINIPKLRELETIRLPDGTEILPAQIIYSEYHNHIVSIYFKKKYIHEIRISQTELEKLLSEYPFFYSPIRGTLINLNEASLQKNDMFLMSNGQQIPIARRKKKEAEDTYMSFRFQKLIKELKD